MSDETKKKIGDAHRGKKVSEETKAKIGEKNRGKKVSEESKKKLSESLKNYWANVVWVEVDENNEE